MKPLDFYGISADRGFLCPFDAGTLSFSGALGAVRETALSLPDLLPTGRIRAILSNRLPSDDNETMLEDLSDREARIAAVHYTFLVQAYVWGEPDPPKVLPRCLSVPMAALSDRLGQPPLLTYSSYVLDNWAKIDADTDITLENTRMLQHFLGGQDETWFVLIHVAIEAMAGGALVRMPQVASAAQAGDFERTHELLLEIAEVWSRINGLFDRMPERCDPYIYFSRVRPYIHGWKDNPALPDGIVYEGVGRYGDHGQAFRGQTGSQSSIVPAMDALLGVGHAADPMRTYLDELHVYRPPQHRQFIEDLRMESRLRSFVEFRGNPALTEAYNANINAVAGFRTRHLEYAACYINKQNAAATGNAVGVGTGGTPFMRYLKKHRDETRQRLLPV